MKILSITGGAANMYCGSCMRDNGLALALRKQGHDVVLLPLYTPTKTDEPNASHQRVFFGGISVYLQQKSGLFRWTPKFIDRLWDHPRVIRAFAGRGVAVDSPSLGALTVSMLEGRNGRQRKEIENLLAWLRHEPRPDLITLPYTLLIALARPLKEAIGCPIVCTLQGEELFLEGLSEPWRARSLELIRNQVRDVDLYIAVSEHESRFMSGYLKIPRDRIRSVPLGINLEGHQPGRKTASDTFRIGYFGRIAPEKGLDVLATAFRLLTPYGKCRLDAAGYLPPEHRSYLDKIQRLCEGLDFLYHGEVDREGKIRFFQSIDVFSLPCNYDEPKGLPVLEAMANGVPVVQPRWGAFPELVESTGGGILVDKGSPQALADGILRLWRDSGLAERLGSSGASAVHERYSIDRMASAVFHVYQSAATAPATARATK